MLTESRKVKLSAKNAPGSEFPDTPTEGEVQATAPGQYKVIRRNGKITTYDESKIKVAITKAFLAVEGGQAAASARIHEKVDKLTAVVVEGLFRHKPNNSTVHIEDIQDQVELALMRAGEHKIARAYVLYREEQSVKRQAETQQVDIQQVEDLSLIHI